MIRDRLKSVARKAAIRLLHMESETVEVQKPQGVHHTVRDIDESKIPKVVVGSGDTPGPNHKHNIGRPFAAAQLAGGENALFIDTRDPEELAAGLIPSAILMPGDSIKRHRDALPSDTTMRIVVFDQTGDGPSIEVGAWLRDEGWVWARRLVGGFAEWLENGEDTLPATAPEGGSFRPGDPATLTDGRQVRVLTAESTPEGPRYTLWLTNPTDTDEPRLLGPVPERELKAG